MAYDRFGTLGGRRIDVLYHAQEEKMALEIETNPAFRLAAPVKLESYRGDRVAEVGAGTLALTRSGYVYDGTIDGERATLAFDPRNVPTLPSDLGRNIQIYEGYVLYQFVIEDVTLPTKFVIAAEHLHKRSNAAAEGGI